MAAYEPKFCGEHIGTGKLMDNQELCEILSDVVKCPSVFGNEGDCGRLLEKIAKDNGLLVEIMPTSGEGRFNVMITLGADSYLEKKHGLIIHGHYDTVPVLDMPDPYNTEVKDNIMCGRGIVDQKSGLVAGLCAAIATKRSGKQLKKPLCIACVVDEESEHRGSYALGKSGIQADWAIVTEPTNGNCEFGCKGTTPIKITVKGLTAHASNPWIGVNAIEKSMPILQGLFAMQFPEVDLGEFGTYRGTICVSKMDAGTAYNNVPGEAVIWMDRRTVPGENTPLALQQVRDVLAEAKKQVPDLQATAEVARPDWHWPEIRERGLNPTCTPSDCELYSVLNRAAAKAGLPPVVKKFCNGYNDMDFLVNDLGIPTLVYGSGDGRMAHTAHEEVDVDVVCRTAEVFCNMIEELCM